MTLPETAYMRLSDDLNVCRIINGMWQVSGTHGAIDPSAAVQAMMDYHEDGFTTWDLADHYGPAEDFIGDFRKAIIKKHGEGALAQVQAFTKWVPRPGRMSADVVEKAVDTALRRMGVEALDMLQFHWWDYRDTNYLSALNHLSFLTRKGKIKHLSLTNFDTKHLRNLNNNGIRIRTNQVQYSVLDRRPEMQMIPYGLEQQIGILAYGTLAGGLLSDRYLGQPEPTREQLDTASLRKYKGMIDQWGGWALFQELLQAMRGIADKHSVNIANVAIRYVLDQPGVVGAIIGARLGVSDNREENKQVFTWTLDEDDVENIYAVTDRAKNLFKVIGDTGDEYRR